MTWMSIEPEKRKEKRKVLKLSSDKMLRAFVFRTLDGPLETINLNSHHNFFQQRPQVVAQFFINSPQVVVLQER